ncbi:MAG: hypothetical protein R2789_02200 [Microthrixaceae bacterium]
MRFSSQVWPGDVLITSGTVSRVEPGSDGTEVDVDLVCTRRDGSGAEDVAISGSATFLLG